MPTAYNAMNTGTILSDRRELDYADRIVELYPDAGPLTVLTKKIGKQVVNSTQFFWFEGNRNLRWTAFAGTTDAANVAANTAQTSFVVTSGTGSYFREGDLLKNPATKEIMIVTGVVDANTIGVIRGYGATAGVKCTNGDQLILIGNAHMENQRAGTMRMGQPSKVSNFTQIIRNAVAISNTLDAEKQRSNPQERARLQAKVGIEHLIDIEYNQWFGEAREDLTGTEPRRTMGGVLSFATQNVMDIASRNSGNLTMALLEEFTEGAFANGSGTKYLFAAPKLISVLDLLLAGKYQIVDKAETWNVTAKEFTTSHGTIRVIKHPLFEGTVYGKMGVLLDLNVDELGYVALQGRDTKLKINVGENDRDGKLDEYITECSLKLPQASKHAVLTGVTGAA